MDTRNGRGRTALVTGASSGIGEAYARELAARGWDLILVARRGELLAALAEELAGAHGIHAEALPADLSDAEGTARVEACIAACATLDLLVSNAGFNVPGPLAQADLAAHLAIIAVHVVASVRLARAALPGMIARGHGALILMASAIAFLPAAPGHATYHATKRYLITLAEDLHAELRSTGVRVQAICPGFVRTHIFDSAGFERPDGLRREDIPGWLWTPVERVVRRSLAALRGRRVVVVPGLPYQALRIGAPLLRAALPLLVRPRRG